MNEWEKLALSFLFWSRFGDVLGVLAVLEVALERVKSCLLDYTTVR
jgi:hypothetical protein